MEGLRRLEYRGYDSAGIALYRNGKIETRKHVGELKNLEKIIADPEYDSYMGIGHTRWATHGVPSDINAHPHSNSDNTITVVHNGIIENFLELRRMLEEEHNVVFRSDTDTEVIAHLISLYYDGDLHEAVNKAVAKMRGAYAIAVICASEPDKIIGVRKDAPLVAGIGEGCNFLASDIPAFLRYVRRVIFLENNETVVVTREKITIYDENNEQVEREPYHVDWDVDAAEKGGYPFFMMKEIHEQPKALADTLKRRLDENGDIVLDGISLAREDIDRLSRIYIVACGTAYHAGLVGKYVIEKMTRILWKWMWPVSSAIGTRMLMRIPCSSPSASLARRRIRWRLCGRPRARAHGFSPWSTWWEAPWPGNRMMCSIPGRDGNCCGQHQGVCDAIDVHVYDRSIYGQTERDACGSGLSRYHQGTSGGAGQAGRLP